MRCLPHNVLVMALVGSLALPAFAEPAPRGEAEALIDKGVDLRLEKRDAEALDLFERSHKLRPSPVALAQIGLVEQALGRWIVAEQHLEQALATPKDPWIARNKAVLDDSLRAVQQHLAWLQVESNIPGAEVWVNDARIATVPMLRPVRILRATLLISVRAPGYETVEVRRNAVSEDLMRESISLVKVRPKELESRPPAPPVTPLQSPSATEGPPSHASKRWAYVSGGIGLAGMAVTGVLAGLALNKTKGLPTPCRDNPTAGCTPDQGQRINDARGLASLANVTFGIGLAGLGLGTVLFLTARSSPPRGATGLSLEPQVSAGYQGLRMAGSF